MSRDYDRRRGGSDSGSSSNKLRMDTNVSQPRSHGENSGKRRELDSVEPKARESQSSYWNKKLLEVEGRDPNRWRHSRYKVLYVGDTESGEPSRGQHRSPRNPRSRSPHSRRPRSPRTKRPCSPRDRSHTRGRLTRSPSIGSTCSDRSCSVCSPKERRRITLPSRSRSRSLTPVRARAHPKDIVLSSSQVIRVRTRLQSPPLPRPRTPPPIPQPPPCHQKDYKTIKDTEAKVRRKEKHHTRIPEDPHVPDPIPLVIIELVQMCKPVKVEKTHSGHGATQMIRPPPESSPSEESDSSSITLHMGPPRMTLSERFGKTGEWSVDRRDLEKMKISVCRKTKKS